MNYQQTFLNLPKNIVRETQGELLTTPKRIAEHMKHTAELAQETFNVITVDTKNRLIDTHLVSLGTLNAAIIHPREVFRCAILDNAASICVSHNHPSGDPTPSSEDIKITRKLIEAGKILGIKVLDHVIIGQRRPSSNSYNNGYSVPYRFNQ